MLLSFYSEIVAKTFALQNTTVPYSSIDEKDSHVAKNR